jgi:hypothetical protein
MRLLLACCLAAWCVVIGFETSGAAGTGPCDRTAKAEQDVFSAELGCYNTGEAAAATSADPAAAGTVYSYVPVCVRDDGLTGDGVRGCGQACGDDGTLFDVWATRPGGEAVSVGQRCFQAGEDVPPSITPDQALRALGQVPLPESTLVVAPPGGRTLVNFDTIFSTVAVSFSAQVPLLGHQIDFRLRPTLFAWTYGDGANSSTDSPGIAYAADLPFSGYLTHRYLTAGTADTAPRPSVDTTWSARFSFNGGPWLDVPGTVTKVGAPERIDVLTASPQLVAPLD